MKHTATRTGFCIQSGEQFVAQWWEPQFTSYYLSDFRNVHIFYSEEEAKQQQGHFPFSTIKRIQITITKELI